MKNVIIKFLSLGFIFLSLFGCNNDKKEHLINTWTVTDIETATSLEDTVKTKMLLNSEMVFTKDGQYRSSGGIGVDEGTYTLDKDEKNLSTISSAGKGNSVYVIEKLSEEDLVLNNNGNTVTCKARNAKN